MDCSLASNESILNIHTGNVTRSRELEIIGIAAALKLDERNPVLSLLSVKSDDESKGEDEKILVASGKEYEEKEEVEDDGKKIKPEDYSNESENQIIEANSVISLPLVKESEDAEKSDLESDYGDDESNVEELIKLNCKEQSISGATAKQEDKETVEDDDDDVKEIIQDKDDSSICCRSDTSNNSISSFTFPILHSEDGSVKTLSLETIWNVCDKRLELSQPQLQRQFYFIPATHTITQLPPQRKSSFSKPSSETQSQKAQKSLRNRWFSCFWYPCQHD